MTKSSYDDEPEGWKKWSAFVSDVHRQWTASEMEEAELMKHDLYAIGSALGVGAKPYSGHEAVERDFLPAIQALKDEKDRVLRGDFTAHEIATVQIRELLNSLIDWKHKCDDQRKRAERAEGALSDWRDWADGVLEEVLEDAPARHKIAKRIDVARSVAGSTE